MLTTDALKTLFHPFVTGDIPLPARDARVLFLGAEPGFVLPKGFAARLSLVQGFRPHFRILQAQGHEVTPRPEGDGYDLALVLLGRHRGQNEMRLAEAVARTRPGGTILAAGGKTEGADSLRKRFARALPLQGHVAKFHGAAFWFERPGDGLPEALVPGVQPLVGGRFHAAPGMFSHDRVDPASKLLADHLPGDIAGVVADFCAGWGFLAAEVAARFPAVSALDFYEADYESLEAAKRNLEPLTAAAKTYFWLDLLAEPVGRRYDFIVMNPPFHQGRAADPAIGQGMVRAASAALKPGGRLVMVANRGLPYEAALSASFKASGETCRDARFKVLWGRK